MELRSCSHLHFISAIRCGEVIKFLNINRGKPALAFKNIHELYDSEDSAYCDLLMKSHTKADRSVTVHSANVKAKIEPTEEHKTVDNDLAEAECNSGDINQRNDDFDDLNFGKMTLKKFIQTCKAQKRKLSKYANQSKESLESCPVIKQEYVDMQPEEDEFDWDEALRSWKSKLSKRSMAKKQKSCSASFETCVVVGDNIDISEPDYLKGEDATCCLDSSFVTDHQGACLYKMTRDSTEIDDGSYPKQESLSVLEASQGCSLSKVSHEVPKTCDGCSPKAKSLSILEECQSCELNQVSYEYTTNEDCYEVTETGYGCSPKPNSLSVLEESQGCTVKQASFEHPEDAEDSSDIPETSKFEEIMKVDDTPIMDNQSLVLPSMELIHKENIADLVICKESPETSCLGCHSSDYDNLVDGPYAPGIPVHISISAEAQAPSMVSGNVQGSELTYHDQACQFRDEIQEYMLPDSFTVGINGSARICGSTLDSNLGFTANEMASQDYDTPMTQDRETSTFADRNALRNCFPDGKICDGTDEAARSLVDESCDHSELQHPPDRLFSARKTISPTSQERLCRLMNFSELHDKSGTHECREKIFYEKRGENSDSRTTSDLESDDVFVTSRRSSCINIADITGDSGKTIRKVKDESKCISKGPQPSHVLPCLSSGCSSNQSCSQSAIAFSQQQMHDIERLAMKLTKELRSMREIVAETLPSEARMATTRYNTNDVRVAVEHAAKVEETTKRWLSMMTRDCNRFCKIMSLAGKDARRGENGINRGTAENAATAAAVASPGTMAHKERKISFADEAGGRLCQVRFYEDNANSPPLCPEIEDELQAP
ncbi:hypothetical protein Nepgr_005992 [Nepenthes gracilis]|uniref:Uncharacterized protein n=1 Tax=Nepenthes gracilis TaxID=150966 RepID=A0AAD3XH00_NEPGR|nr:hypothetical protein Nepgr_005992 [Nepenthes gracilis]